MSCAPPGGRSRPSAAQLGADRGDRGVASVACPAVAPVLVPAAFLSVAGLAGRAAPRAGPLRPVDRCGLAGAALGRSGEGPGAGQAPGLRAATLSCGTVTSAAGPTGPGGAESGIRAGPPWGLWGRGSAGAPGHKGREASGVPVASRTSSRLRSWAPDPGRRPGAGGCKRPAGPGALVSHLGPARPCPPTPSPGARSSSRPLPPPTAQAGERGGPGPQLADPNAANEAPSPASLGLWDCGPSSPTQLGTCVWQSQGRSRRRLLSAPPIYGRTQAWHPRHPESKPQKHRPGPSVASPQPTSHPGGQGTCGHAGFPHPCTQFEF